MRRKKNGAEFRYIPDKPSDTHYRNAILLTGVLWISGRLIAGKDKARFTDALWIAVLGTVIADVLGIFITGIVATLIVLIIWIMLIKHFFDCGWLKAIAIGIIAILMLIVIPRILALIGITILTFIQRETFPSSPFSEAKFSMTVL